jgi:hypothetical protein
MDNSIPVLKITTEKKIKNRLLTARVQDTIKKWNVHVSMQRA